MKASRAQDEGVPPGPSSKLEQVSELRVPGAPRELQRPGGPAVARRLVTAAAEEQLYHRGVAVRGGEVKGLAFSRVLAGKSCP